MSYLYFLCTIIGRKNGDIWPGPSMTQFVVAATNIQIDKSSA